MGLGDKTTYEMSFLCHSITIHNFFGHTLLKMVTPILQYSAQKRQQTSRKGSQMLMKTITLPTEFVRFGIGMQKTCKSLRIKTVCVW